MGTNMSYAHQVEIFSIKSLPVSTDGINATTCWLDEVNRFEEQIAAISEDVDAIRKLTKDNEASLVKAMNCQYLASSYGIKKLPAIVIDNEFVAYGVDSVSIALEALKDRDRSNA